MLVWYGLKITIIIVINMIKDNYYPYHSVKNNNSYSSYKNGRDNWWKNSCNTDKKRSHMIQNIFHYLLEFKN